MATIHPSRMNLIPQDMRSTHTERDRHACPPSPRRYRRSPSPPARRSRSRDRDGGYPSRRDQHSRYERGPTYGGGGADFLERCGKNKFLNLKKMFILFLNNGFFSRRAQREARTVNIWPPSPKTPARELYLCVVLFNLPTFY